MISRENNRFDEFHSEKKHSFFNQLEEKNHVQFSLTLLRGEQKESSLSSPRIGLFDGKKLLLISLSLSYFLSSFSTRVFNRERTMQKGLLFSSLLFSSSL